MLPKNVRTHSLTHTQPELYPKVRDRNCEETLFQSIDLTPTLRLYLEPAYMCKHALEHHMTALDCTQTVQYTKECARRGVVSYDYGSTLEQSAATYSIPTQD